MEINQEYLDKTIHWINLRCYGNVKAHSENVLAFVQENGDSINGQIKVEVAFNSFNKLTELLDELNEIEPNRKLRNLYQSLGFAIIAEDYIKAEKCRNSIIDFK